MSELATWWRELLDWLGGQTVAGVAGSILGMLWAPGKTKRQQALTLATGIACAVIVAPYVIEQFKVPTLAGQRLTMFLLGLFGMRLVSRLFEAEAKVRVVEVKAAILRFLNLQGPPK